MKFIIDSENSFFEGGLTITEAVIMPPIWSDQKKVSVASSDDTTQALVFNQVDSTYPLTILQVRCTKGNIPPPKFLGNLICFTIGDKTTEAQVSVIAETIVQKNQRYIMRFSGCDVLATEEILRKLAILNNHCANLKL